MKLSAANNPEENTDVQAEPRLRNIREEKEETEEKPEGSSLRFKIGTAALGMLVLFAAIKGYAGNASLSSQVNKQQKLLSEAKAAAKEYGIEEDEDGDLVIPDLESDSPESGPVKADDKEALVSFAGLLLNWKGTAGYNEARQTLIDEWGFSENGKLLKYFMPPVAEELDANMSMVGNPTIFVLSEGEDGTSYFLLCTVRNSIDGTSASGMVGIQVTIGEDGTFSKVTAQTLA